MLIARYLIAAVIGYLLGCISSGVLIGKAFGLKDIRKVVLHRVTARKERCEECGKVRYCDDYNVSNLDGSE